MNLLTVILISLLIGFLGILLINSQQSKPKTSSNLYYGYWHKDGFLEIIKE